MRIRLPADLKDKVEAAAAGLRRSMNAEIVARLEQSFDVDAVREDARGIVDKFSQIHELVARLEAAGLLPLKK